MALPTRTLDQLISRALGHFRTSFPGFPMGFKKFLGRTARGLGKVVWGLHKALEDLDADIVPSASMSTDLLTDWAFNLGLPDGEGGFGRLKATISSGGAASLTGVKATVYPDGDTATAEDGVTQIALSGSVTIPGSAPGFGSVDAVFVSVTTGEDANLPIGTVCTWDSPVSGADDTFTLTAPLQGAIDSETNPSVFQRILQRLQNPPRGGTSEDIEFWATVDGVDGIYIYPRRGGTGTVDVVITTAGTGQARRPSVSLLADVQDAFDNNRPVASERITAIAPYMPNSSGHQVIVEVTPTSKYPFDWDDRGGSYFVDDYDGAASPPTITFDTAIPASLKAAIDAYTNGTGEAPRIHVISDTSVFNKAIEVVAYDVTETILDLGDIDPEWVAPTLLDGTEPIHAYGPVVESIGDSIVELVDSLGPSKSSGFADESITWSDKLTVSAITAIAEEAADSDGTEFLDEVPVGGVTIDGSAADLTPDDVDNNNPEILYLSHVLVVQA